MVSEILAIIIAALKLIALGLGEYFAWKRRERLELEEYEKERDEQLKVINDAVMRMRERARRESREAGELEDERERDRRRTRQGEK